MSALIKPLPEGVLLSDKPKGWTSFDVVRRVKKWVRPAKVGHTGTLDPMATGLLPLTIGEATKLTRPSDSLTATDALASISLTCA
jgi:tRNA pseudouridine55 synthase